MPPVSSRTKESSATLGNPPLEGSDQRAMLSMKGKLKVKTRADTAPLIAVVCLWTVASACSGMKGASTSRELSVASTEQRELKADIVSPGASSWAL